MTKRPEKSEFLEQYKAFNEDKKALASHYNVNLGTIYNWITRYIEGVESTLVEGKTTFEDFVKVHKESLIKPRERIVDLSLEKNALIVCLSDTHLGSTYVDVDRLSDDLKLIAETEGVLAIFDGDIIDYSISGPKDLLYDQIFSNPKFAKDWAREMVQKIQHKLIAIVSGCHDKWEYSETGEYFGDELAKYTVTNVFVPDALILNINYANVAYKIFMSHKLKGSSFNNLQNAMKRKAKEELDCDVMIQAHFHRSAICNEVIRDHPMTFINCDSYKRIDTYTASLGAIEHKGTTPGFYIDSQHKRIIPFLNWRDGIAYLEANRK
jgi:predicted MPP superfamily phosphohydrolase